MNKLLLAGVIPPIITPLNADRSVDEASLQALADHMIRSGVSGIFALGTASEAPMLTKRQRGQVLSALRRTCAGRVPLLVGVLETGTDRTLECVAEAEAAGADGLVAMAPYYYKVKQKEIVRHFAAIREATELPVVLYNIPAYLGTGNTIEPDTIAEIARWPNMAGYKDSSGHMAAFQKTIRLTGDIAGFHVLQGVQSLSAVSLRMGASGLVPGIGNIIPGEMVRLYEAVREGRLEEADRLQQTVIRLDDLLAGGDYSLAVMKAMAAQLGFGNGMPHYPWPAVPQAQSRQLRQALREMGIEAVRAVSE